MPTELDNFKIFNEEVKAFDALKKLESDVLQKLSQANDDRDLEAKAGWAAELVEIIETLRAMNTSRRDKIKSLREPDKQQTPSTHAKR